MESKAYLTHQEEFWAGEFGTNYIERNKSQQQAISAISFFSKIIQRTGSLESVVELGANIGVNLHAVHTLLPHAKIRAIEINTNAHAELSKHTWIDAHHGSILDIKYEMPASNLSFISGVLIHIEPTRLSDAYEALYRTSNRFILVNEYYNPQPVEVPYRGHTGKLFKRDFAGEMLDRFKNLRLIDYGFQYHRDPAFPMDDTTWFLMEKNELP